jgi:hypothetical protein
MDRDVCQASLHHFAADIIVLLPNTVDPSVTLSAKQFCALFSVRLQKSEIGENSSRALCRSISTRTAVLLRATIFRRFDRKGSETNSNGLNNLRARQIKSSQRLPMKYRCKSVQREESKKVRRVDSYPLRLPLERRELRRQYKLGASDSRIFL